MEQHQVFTPIAEPGQLAHQSATHSNALVENPFDDLNTDSGAGDTRGDK
ncbi:streptamidine family RiPP [Streptomyces sp. NPDC005953]